jgi:hypothetical protein
MQYSAMADEIRSETVRIMALFEDGVRLCEVVMNQYGG